MNIHVRISLLTHTNQRLVDLSPGSLLQNNIFSLTFPQKLRRRGRIPRTKLACQLSDNGNNNISNMVNHTIMVSVSKCNSISHRTQFVLKKQFIGCFAVHYNPQFGQSSTASTRLNYLADCDHNTAA